MKTVNVNLVTGLLWYLLCGHEISGLEYRLTETDPDGLYGVLQVKRSGTWGTVCARGYDENDAKVICRSLSLPDSDARPLERDYGDEVRNVAIDTLECTGRERFLEECPGVNHIASECPTHRMVLVYCAKVWEGKFRMMGHGVLSAGRVELYRRGEWGTVQLNHGYNNDTVAKVFCRSIGFPHKMARFFVSNSRAEGPVWLRDVVCLGDEADWLDCRHEFYAVRKTVGHYADVSISCEDLRQRQGESLYGYYQDEWRPVYSEHFDDMAATVACKVLGQKRSGARVVDMRRSSGDVQFVLNVAKCLGYEDRLTQCTGTRWIKRQPGQITIQCVQADTSRVKFRLENTESKLVGRLSVFQGGRWGTVCGEGVSQATAQVACRTIGLPSSQARAVPTAYVGEGTGDIVMQGLTCQGYESSLLQCNFNRWNNGICYHWSDLGLSCGGGSATEDFDLRLMDGEDDNSGRVEISFFGSWHRVCRNSIPIENTNTVKTVCRQLNLPSSSAKITDCFGGGTNRFWTHMFDCTGGEDSLKECTPLPTRRCSPLKVICSDTYLDDSDCFGVAAWVYVLVIFSILLVLVVIACIALRMKNTRRERRENTQGLSGTRVRCTLSVTDAHREARVEMDLPPPYSDPPPSYNDVVRAERELNTPHSTAPQSNIPQTNTLQSSTSQSNTQQPNRTADASGDIPPPSNTPKETH